MREGGAPRVEQAGAQGGWDGASAQTRRCASSHVHMPRRSRSAAAPRTLRGEQLRRLVDERVAAAVAAASAGLGPPPRAHSAATTLSPLPLGALGPVLEHPNPTLAATPHSGCASAAHTSPREHPSPCSGDSRGSRAGGDSRDLSRDVSRLYGEYSLLMAALNTGASSSSRGGDTACGGDDAPLSPPEARLMHDMHAQVAALCSGGAAEVQQFLAEVPDGGAARAALQAATAHVAAGHPVAPQPQAALVRVGRAGVKIRGRSAALPHLLTFPHARFSRPQPSTLRSLTRHWSRTAPPSRSRCRG